MDNCKTTERGDESDDALKETLGITKRILEAAAPPETYWPHYHARLREKLKEAREPNIVSADARSWLTSFFGASVSVPVPLGLALALVFGFALLFAFRTSHSTQPPPQIVRVPVEVPVVQEKIVTRVVYRERRLAARKRVVDASKVDSTFAKSQKADIPASLTGFKPTEEVKLTVIKGGSQNEK